MNKKKLASGSAVVLVLLVIIGAIAGSRTEKTHLATTTNTGIATPQVTQTARQSATAAASSPRTQAAPTHAAATKLKPYRRPASFYIHVTARIAGQHIQVEGTTNVPDGTVLTLSAQREFKQTHGAERMNFLGLNGPTQANVHVHGGHFSGQLSSREQDLAAVMKGDPGGPVAAVDPDADVCVVLNTGRDFAVNAPWRQPPRVRADIGTYGVFLRGSPGVGTFGSLTKHPSLYILATTRVPLDPSALVGDLAAQQTVTPQLATLPNLCGP